jgi:hypothetical protein
MAEPDIGCRLNLVLAQFTFQAARHRLAGHDPGLADAGYCLAWLNRKD